MLKFLSISSNIDDESFYMIRYNLGGFIKESCVYYFHGHYPGHLNKKILKNLYKNNSFLKSFDLISVEFVNVGWEDLKLFFEFFKEHFKEDFEQKMNDLFDEISKKIGMKFFNYKEQEHDYVVL